MQVEQLKQDISEFEQLYNAKIRRLYTQLNELERLLFKYSHISEYVDDIFSFEEAEKIFEQTMKDRRARMENEYKKTKKSKIDIDKRKQLKQVDRQRLKMLYRELARIFHPDKNGGNEEMMKKINKAYRDADIESLRNLQAEQIVDKADSTFSGLESQLERLMRQISNANKEMFSLRKSDMYVLKRNLMRKHNDTKENILEMLSKELRKEIRTKQERLEGYIDKFGLEPYTS